MKPCKCVPLILICISFLLNGCRGKDEFGHKKELTNFLQGYVWSYDYEEYPVMGAIVNVYHEGGVEPIVTTTSDYAGEFGVKVESCGKLEVQASYIHDGAEFLSERMKVYFNVELEDKAVTLYIDFGG